MSTKTCQSFASIILALIICIGSPSISEEIPPQIQPALDALRNDGTERYFEIIEGLIESGDPIARLFHSKYLINRQLNLKDGIALLRPLAESGDIEAQFFLGETLYLKGEDIEARIWLNLAIEKGHEHAKDTMNSLELHRVKEKDRINISDYIRVYRSTFFTDNLLSKGIEAPSCSRFDLTQSHILINYLFDSCEEKLLEKLGNNFPWQLRRDTDILLETCMSENLANQTGNELKEAIRCLSALK